jgi:hypothetical protein
MQTNLSSIFGVAPRAVELYKLAATLLADVILLAVVMSVFINFG